MAATILAHAAATRNSRSATAREALSILPTACLAGRFHLYGEFKGE
ncbi:hypothetical protein PCH70_39500 [Pseudomonas cichorii JBC1]|nr:hypothetical protein PCH70_39500 [Pseudomonas cichorii JBC1]